MAAGPYRKGRAPAPRSRGEKYQGVVNRLHFETSVQTCQDSSIENSLVIVLALCLPTFFAPSGTMAERCQKQL